MASLLSTRCAGAALAHAAAPRRATIGHASAPVLRVARLPSARASAFAAGAAPKLPVRAAPRSVARAAVVTSASSAAPAFGLDLAAIRAKYPKLETAIYIGLWYFFNVKFNLLNKQVRRAGTEVTADEELFPPSPRANAGRPLA